MMTEHEQRIAINEWMGWTNIHRIRIGADWVGNLSEGKTFSNLEPIPDPPNDLNAMHEAEKKLDAKQSVWYLQRLSQVRLRQGHGGTIACIIDKLAFATSQQRSEALCRVIKPERFEE